MYYELYNLKIEGWILNVFTIWFRNILKYATHLEFSNLTDLTTLNFPYHLSFVYFFTTSQSCLHNLLTYSVRFTEIIKINCHNSDK